MPAEFIAPGVNQFTRLTVVERYRSAWCDHAGEVGRSEAWTTVCFVPIQISNGSRMWANG